jgi:hypothetical protein
VLDRKEEGDSADPEGGCGHAIGEVVGGVEASVGKIRLVVVTDLSAPGDV